MVRAMYSVRDVPAQLRDLKAPEWKQPAALRDKYFPYKEADGTQKTKRARKNDILKFPICILLTAKCLGDRVTLVNWWLSLSKEDQQDIHDRSKDFYVKWRHFFTDVHCTIDMYRH